MKNRCTSLLAGSLALVLPAADGLHASDIKPVSLRCEQLVRPLGVDVQKPRLSWQLESDRRARKQSAYQILVASSREKLDGNNGDLRDSGKVESDQSLNVIYEGNPPQSRGQYFWKVGVWGGGGGEPTWSKPASWSMGIPSGDAWRALESESHRFEARD